MDKELLEIMVCPETKQPLSEAAAEIVGNLNNKIEQGRLQNRAGEAITQKIDGGLVRQDGKILYPIIDNIPVMLIEEAIELD